SGRRVFMADLRSSTLLVGDPATHEVVERIGPFSAPIRPYTVNGAGTLAFVNVNGLLGFEVGDVTAGKMLARVEVPGYKQGPLEIDFAGGVPVRAGDQFGVGRVTAPATRRP